MYRKCGNNNGVYELLHVCSLLTWSNLLAIFISSFLLRCFQFVWIVSVAFNCKQFPWLSSSNREEYAPYKWTGLIKSSLRSAGSFTIRRNSLRIDFKNQVLFLNLQQWIVRLLVQFEYFFSFFEESQSFLLYLVSPSFAWQLQRNLCFRSDCQARLFHLKEKTDVCIVNFLSVFSKIGESAVVIKSSYALSAFNIFFMWLCPSFL